jgi:hypothetical protein
MMQRTVPVDEAEDNEEIEIDEDVVVENSKYSLLEVTTDILSEETDPLDDILSDPTEVSKLKRSLGDLIYEEGIEFVFRDLASITVGGDELFGVIRIIFNIFVQIRGSNNEVERQQEIIEEYLRLLEENPDTVQQQKDRHLRAMQDHIAKIQEIQEDLGRDLTDLAQGVIALIPDDVGGPIAIIESALGKAAETLPEIFESLEISELSELEVAIKQAPEFSGLRYLITFLTGFKFLANFAPLAMGLPGIPVVILSLLNVNFFNPVKIVTMGVQNMFVISMLQNRLLIAHKMLKDDDFRLQDPDTPEPSFDREFSDDNREYDSEILRRLFITKPGDPKGFFEESLEKRTLSYLLEEKEDDEVNEDEEEVNEFSGAGAIGIGTLPLGMSTKSDSGAHSSHSGGKAYPYGKKSQRKHKQYARKTFGGK